MTDYVLNRTDGEIALGIYGEIGKEVDGHEFARYLTDYISHNDYHTINIHINSQGGNVVHGMSIFTALYNIRNKVVMHIDGLALSMAGVIAMAGRRVVMNDFGRLMIHNPFLKDNSKLSKNDQNMLDQMRGMLTDIFVNLRGLDKQKLEELMNAETWFTAIEAKDAGLVDEVIATGLKAEISAEMKPEDIVTVINQIANNLNLKTKTMDVKKILAALHLDDNATEEKVLGEIGAKDTRIAELTAQVADLNAKIKSPDDYLVGDISMKLGFNGPVTIDKALDAIDDLKEKAGLAEAYEGKFNDLLSERINEILSHAVADRKFPATQKNYYRQLLQGDFENGKRIIAGLNPVQRIADFVQSEANIGEDRSKWKWEDYQEKDPQALLAMEKDAPEIFAALYKQHYKRPYQG